MDTKWYETTLGNVLTLQRGFDLSEDKRIPGMYPVIASTGIVGSHNQAMVKAPGVVIGRSGSIGGGQFIKSDFWPLNTTLWVKDFKGNNPRFCYYLLKSLDLNRFNAGSGVPTLNRNHIHPLPIRMPESQNEQRTIAHLLGMLDDKIELNREMNETLEAMARAIFKSWFIDFDPVHAKAQGRDPKLPKEIADLFPSEFQDSELGKIPKGWRVGKIGDICDVIGGFAYKSEIFCDYGYPVIKIKNINSDRTVNIHDVEYIPEIVALETRNFWLSDGDLIMAMTGATVGKFGLIVNTGKLPAVLNQRVAKFLPFKNHANLPWFIYSILQSQDIVDQIVSIADGSAQPNISPNGIKSPTIIVPHDPLIKFFNTRVDCVFKQVLAHQKQSHVLTAIRDTLLPKLLSGEIRVKDAENVI